MLRSALQILALMSHNFLPRKFQDIARNDCMHRVFLLDKRFKCKACS